MLYANLTTDKRTEPLKSRRKFSLRKTSSLFIVSLKHDDYERKHSISSF